MLSVKGQAGRWLQEAPHPNTPHHPHPHPSSLPSSPSLNIRLVATLNPTARTGINPIKVVNDSEDAWTKPDLFTNRAIAAGQKSRQRFRPENKAECCCSSLVTFGFIEERDYAGSGENSFLFTTGNTTAFFKEYSSRV